MQELIRELELDNGDKVYFKAGPVHPFWRINFAQGSVPPKLAGQYTDFDKAVAAVKAYVESRPARNRTTVTDKIVDKTEKK